MSETSKTASNEALQELHNDLAKSLSKKIKTGEATAAELSVARQFLKDNGIDAIPRKANPLGQLADSLPFPDADGVMDEDGDWPRH